MASVTLAESAKLAQDELISGVIENIITVNQMYELLPFMPIDGNALSYNRENVLGDAQVLGVGDTITAKAAATFTKVTTSLTTIVGDAEVNGLIQATRSANTDQEATQVGSKAKTVGRKFQDMLINGTGSSNQFTGLLGLVSNGQTLTAGANGANLTFDMLDSLIDLVLDKDGQVDFIAMPARTRRAYLALLRGLGGASIDDVVQLPSGVNVPAYRGIPIFRNDWIPTDQTQGSASTCTTVFAGTLDDGSGMHGISGITASEMAGIQVEDVGIHQSRDEKITRVKWYCGLALFSDLGLAALKGVLN
jgi:hypothetical protein